jgi:nicotinamidase-related amidase
VATNGCGETTARQAFLKDDDVVFPNDCTATHYAVRNLDDSSEETA